MAEPDNVNDEVLYEKKTIHAYGGLDLRGDITVDGNPVISSADFQQIASALYLDGTVSNHATTPDQAAFTPTTSLEIMVAVAMDDITPPAAGALAAQYATAGTYSWAFIINTNTTVSIYCSADGTALSFPNNSTIPASLTPGGLKALKGRWAPNLLQYYEKSVSLAQTPAELIDPSGWTKLGDDHVAGVPATLFNSAQALSIGAVSGGATQLQGGAKVVAAALVIDGVLQAAPDFRKPIPNRYRDPVGRIWTLNGSAYSWADAPLV